MRFASILADGVNLWIGDRFNCYLADVGPSAFFSNLVTSYGLCFSCRVTFFSNSAQQQTVAIVRHAMADLEN